MIVASRCTFEPETQLYDPETDGILQPGQPIDMRVKAEPAVVAPGGDADKGKGKGTGVPAQSGTASTTPAVHHAPGG